MTPDRTTRRSRAAVRTVTGALCAVLVAITAVAILGAVHADRSATRLERSGDLVEAYLDLTRAVAVQDTVEEQTSTRTLRRKSLAKFAEAEASIERSLAVLEGGDRRDRELAVGIRRYEQRYAAALKRYFSVLDAGDGEEAEEAEEAVDPPALALGSLVSEGGPRRATESLREIEALRASQANSLRLILVSVLLGVGAIAALAGVLRSLRRKIQTATDERLDRLEQAAFTDSLTGIRNHRAFEEDLARGLAERQEGGTLSLVLIDVDGLKGINDTEGHQAGDRAITSVGDVLRSTMRTDEAVYRIGGDEFAALLPDTTAWEAFGFAQRVHASLHSGGAHATVSAGVAEAHEGSTRDGLTEEADLALMEAKVGGRDTIVFQPGMARPDPSDEEEAGDHRGTLASALARAVDAKDSYTHAHSETVSELCALIAGRLGLDGQHIAAVRLAGLVHDVGKIGIPDAILQKPAALDPQEFETIKGHSALGHRILQGTDLSHEAPWVLYHHERLDGSGYPGGLAGEQIPLESRIIHVADAFEAMISDRPYRRGMPQRDAVAELERHRGTQFDPAVVDALLLGLGIATPAPTTLATA